jgi:hypothetical protein
METTFKTLKAKVKKATVKFEKIQEELLEQIANSRSSRSLSRYNASFELQK